MWCTRSPACMLISCLKNYCPESVITDVIWLNNTCCFPIMSESKHVEAHAHSIRHRDELMRSDTCGCFYCCRNFPPQEIYDWINDGSDESDQTAICPHCGIDSVIGSDSGFPTSQEFLRTMNEHWFWYTDFASRQFETKRRITNGWTGAGTNRVFASLITAESRPGYLKRYPTTS